jgi:hypothetical protein
MNRFVRLMAALLLGGLAACGSSSTPAGRNVVITWNANKESGVNKAGGGYRVQIDTQTPIDVPYVSGAAAPTTTTVQLGSGTYAITVVAYAALDARGGTSGANSSPSQATAVTVP